MARRRKFWGWGFEDQQPPREEVEAVAAGAREHLGIPARTEHEVQERERARKIRANEVPAA